MRTQTLVLVALFSSYLVGCGSSSHSAPQSPVFTSTPITAASQGMSYAYSLTATDPSGGTVTFSLTTGPAGATLSGSNISWIPTAAESRVSNNFTANATSSSGGSAAQSWTVTPTGTVTINWVNTDWMPAGPVQTPAPPNFIPSALVPQPDGSLELISGALVSPGIFSINQVPGGYYWLIQGVPPGIPLPPTAFWTNSSTFDLGRDSAGVPTGILESAENTVFDFTLSGLDPLTAPGVIGFMTDNPSLPPIYLTPQPDAATLSTSASVTSRFDWATANTAFLVQYEPVSLGTFNNLVAEPEFTLSNLALTSGTTNSISAALAPSPQASLNLSIPGSQWESLFQNVAPAAASPISSWLSIAPEPYVVGVNAKPQLFGAGFGATLYLLQPESQSGFPYSLNVCPSEPFFLSAGVEPPVLTDQNLGTLQYGDPFPANWTRELSFCQSVIVPFQVGSNSFPMALNYGMTVDPSTLTLAPMAQPVVNPVINGSNLFTTTSLDNTVATLSWSALGGSTPYGYTVVVFQVIPMQNIVEL
ncbi:MAG TPA: hypothetical protein VK828_07170 [Terriglobales bacterium]|jgi:hypothetical protein|nr:hypothetical protein [Terriglobales bacterium]